MVTGILGVEWSGWIDRYFENLEDRYFENLEDRESRELPDWVVKSYEKSESRRWDFKGAGLVLASDSDEIAEVELPITVGNWITGEYEARIAVWDENPAVREKVPSKLDQIDMKETVSFYRGKDNFKSWNDGKSPKSDRYTFVEWIKY